MYKHRALISHVTKAFTLFTIFLMLYLSISPVYVFSLEVAVSGTVIDEYGQGMKDVEIEVYSSDGTYVKSGSSSSDGSFAIDLTVGGSYVIHFSKDGYTEAARAVSIRRYGTGTVFLGDIVLLKTLRLYSSILNITANPGSKLLLPFTMSNIGEELETAEFLIFNREGWPVRVLDQDGREITKVQLSSSVNLNFQLEVSIPLTATGENELTLTAIGKTVSTLNFSIKVQPLSESIMFCQFPGKSATPGDTVQFKVRVKNPFAYETRFRILVYSVPSGWTASVKSLSGEYVTEVSLSSNEFVDLIVEVETFSSAKAGEEYGLIIKAESYDGSIVASIPLNVVLREAERKIEITAKFPEVTVEAGKIMQYPITISNLGDVDRLLLLSVNPPADWKVVFKSGMVEISRLYLESGRSENLVVEATPPSTVNIGTYTIPIQIKSEEGIIYAEMNLRATIIGSYELRLEPSTLLTSMVAGGSITFTAKITNAGHTAVTGVSLDVDLPEDWDSSVTPVQIESLKPRESFTFTIVINTPDDTVAGDYLITLTGLSDQVKSDQVQVRITVTSPTSWGLIGIGLAAAMVIALVFVFVKFKRR